MAIHAYRLTTLPADDMPLALNDLQNAMAHIQQYQGVTLLGTSVLGTVIITTSGAIPADQLDHLKLVEET